MTEPRIIKGAPVEKWDEVQEVQHEPFVYIMANGSKWAGDEEDDVSVLLDMLVKHPLDPRFEYSEPHFYTVDPCEAEINPLYGEVAGVEHYIDGPRLYKSDGVVRFFGNFLTYSHGFNIDTNHRPTIEALIAAITANVQGAAYQEARSAICKPKATEKKSAKAKRQQELFA